MGKSINNKFLDKSSPKAVEAEEAVLGALLIDKNAMNEVIDLLNPECFYIEKNKIIYKAILHLHQKSEPYDVLTVTNRLRETNELEKVGGAYEITMFTQKISSSANIQSHVLILRQKWVKRELIKAGQLLIENGYKEESDFAETLELAEKQIMELGKNSVRTETKSMESIYQNIIKEQKEREKDGGKGVYPGLKSVYNTIGDFVAGNFYLFAGRPGMGKTALLLKILREVAIRAKRAVGMLSLEMSNSQLGNRLISSELKIEGDFFTKQKLLSEHWKKIYHSNESVALHEAPIYINDAGGINILQLKSTARRMVQDYGIEILMIDYLQLVNGSGQYKGNREQEVGLVSRELKALAKELDIPVIALSQLSRAVETRGGDKRPMLSDLRESGSLEQDADFVAFLYRPTYYGIERDDEGNDLTGVCELIIAKNRHGSTDTIYLDFEGQFSEFKDRDICYINDNNRHILGDGIQNFSTPFDMIK